MAPENTGAAEGQEPAATQPQAGDSKATEQAQAAGAEGESTTVDVAVLQRELNEARREAAKYRTDAKKLADAQKAAAEAQLSDEEKRTQRLSETERENADLKRRVQELSLDMEARDVAQRLGFGRPHVAARFLDTAAVEYDDDGKPKNVERLLKSVLDEMPELKAGSPQPARGVQPTAAPASVSPGADRLRYAYTTESKTRTV